MGNNLRENPMLPDLNQEPSDRPENPQIRLGPTTEERPRRIGVSHGAVDTGSRKGSAKKKSTELIACALETELLHSVDPCYNSGTGGFFNCNVCLSAATEPVLTCCGHLFCWPCFYNMPYEHSDVKECPVCGGDVADTSLVPIYGNGDRNPSSSSSCNKRKRSGLVVPPRPSAKRVESSTPRRGLRGLSNLQIEQRIQQLAALAGRVAERGRALLPSVEPTTSEQRVEAFDFSTLVLPEPPRSLEFFPYESDLPEEPSSNGSRRRRASTEEETNLVPPFRGAAPAETEASRGAASRGSFGLSPRLAEWLGIPPPYGSEFDDPPDSLDDSS